jgi:dTDP-4-dehydrorhamnose reductase
MASMSTETRYPYFNPEIWGGIECTINRIAGDFRDQLDDAGHYTRKDDIEKIAALGIKKIRYPVLWERHMPGKNGRINWQWTSGQFDKIRQHNIVPIAGLLHHGSGPAGTSLEDEKFAVKFAAYAAGVARRFPWLEYYTPVNEPLTTARFSGLYGLWYPHHKNETSFIRMLLNQVKGVILSMEAIRRINPGAKLVQTEDLSKTHSTPLLSYQALFENKRRWLTYDLLCGKFNHEHYFWKYFISRGIKETELNFFLEHHCMPAVAGFNYYVTSERYIDEKFADYPAHTHGGNGKHRYADIEAVRTGHAAGLAHLLKEAWHRYQLPVAVTESHLNCTREEQLRWFNETWNICCDLKKEGLDVTAVTAWSLLGSYDWDSLLVNKNYNYESGVFDIRSGRLRPSCLTKLICSLSGNKQYDHPLLSEKGWWHSDAAPVKASRPLLIIGKNGSLGRSFTKICTERRISCIALSRQELDICKREQISRAIEKYKPWAVVNASGYAGIDAAEQNAQECFAVNATGPSLLATICGKHGLQLMTFSSDLVFDGNKKSPYLETDTVMPLNIYGSSKAEGEKLILNADPSALVIRSSTFFGPCDYDNFVYKLLNSLRMGKIVYTLPDVSISPTYMPDLAGAALDLLIDEEKGIWHISNDGIVTWAGFAEYIAERAGYKNDMIRKGTLNDIGWKARRPVYSVLQSEKGLKLPTLHNALERYFESCNIK